MTLGPSSGEFSYSSPPSVSLYSTFSSPNRFVSLASVPEYAPLAYVDVEVKSTESGEWAATRAMIDCGGQGSFISDSFSQHYHLPHHPKTQPVSLILADGSQSQSGHVTQYNPVTLRTAGNEELLGLDIAPTTHDIVLGMPWLQKHDPAIRFGQHNLTFDSSFCREYCNTTARQSPYIPPHTPQNKRATLERKGSIREMKLGRFCLQGT